MAHGGGDGGGCGSQEALHRRVGDPLLLLLTVLAARQPQPFLRIPVVTDDTGEHEILLILPRVKHLW